VHFDPTEGERPGARKIAWLAYWASKGVEVEAIPHPEAPQVERLMKKSLLKLHLRRLRRARQNWQEDSYGRHQQPEEANVRARCCSHATKIMERELLVV
jgi:hypothetical protein